MQSPSQNPVRNDRDEVVLIGLDFGSTTTSFLAASAPVRFNTVSGKAGFGHPRAVFKPDPVFTPFNGDRIDLTSVDRYLHHWFEESRVLPADVFSGGAIITGLAAMRQNAGDLADLVKATIGEAVIATADDPLLESWLAFMGNCSAMSRLHPETPFINLDIGGGTTNPAYGVNDSVQATGCLFVGARHIRFDPGTYRLAGISDHGRRLMDHFGIRKGEGDVLEASETDAVLNCYVDILEAAVRGDRAFFQSGPAAWLQQVPFAFEAGDREPVIVFSGGVGELVYRLANQGRLPETTAYGDLGVDLARRIVARPFLAASIECWVPENLGRATVYGLTLNSTQISGATLFIADPGMLPCRDLPIVARMPLTAAEHEIEGALWLARQKMGGACVQILPSETPGPLAGTVCPPAVNEPLENIRTFGRRVGETALRLGFAPHQPLVLLAPHNYGQALGNYATDWRRSPVNVIVLDEIPDQRAHFVNIGSPLNQMVPVSFFGVH